MSNDLTQSSPPTPPPLMEITAQRAIALARRWRWLAIVINVALFATLVGAMYAYERGGGLLVIVGLFVLWTYVSSMSAKTRRLAFDAGQHFSAGEYDLAEDRLTQAMTSFSLAGSMKRQGLQQLAMLRHAQARWDEAAILARAFLAGRASADARGDIPSRLVLAESLLELGDLDGVGRTLHDLSQRRLNLRETLLMMQVRLDLQARRGEFASMLSQVQTTVSLIELMPARVSMRCHAILALAARKLDRTAWWNWLRERALLLGDPAPLFESRPYLREAFPEMVNERA